MQPQEVYLISTRATNFRSVFPPRILLIGEFDRGLRTIRSPFVQLLLPRVWSRFGYWKFDESPLDSFPWSCWLLFYSRHPTAPSCPSSWLRGSVRTRCLDPPSGIHCPIDRYRQSSCWCRRRYRELLDHSCGILPILEPKRNIMREFLTWI